MILYLFSRFGNSEQNRRFRFLLCFPFLLNNRSRCGILAYLREGDIMSREKKLNALNESLGDRDNIGILEHLVQVFQLNNYMVLSAFGLCHTFLFFTDLRVDPLICTYYGAGGSKVNSGFNDFSRNFSE